MLLRLPETNHLIDFVVGTIFTSYMIDEKTSMKLSLFEKRRLVQLRRKFPNPVIAVTGYLGKSTLIALLDTILSTRGKVLCNRRSRGSWKNNLELLQKLSPEYDFAIFEFDARNGENFSGLLRLIKPNIAIVTNLGDAHLTYLSNVVKTALKRSQVVSYIARGGVAVLNQDDDLTSSLSEFIKDAHIEKYGLNQNAGFFASDIEQLGPKGIRFKLNNKQVLELPIYSVANVYTFLACVAALTHLQFKIEEIVSIVQQKFHLPKGRGNLLEINDRWVLDESYPGTSRSVSKAARTLIGFKPKSKRLVYIVGDMTEPGVKVADRHLNMGYFLSALPLEYIITLGHYADFIGRGVSLIPADSRTVISVPNVDVLLDVLRDIAIPGTTISVKGLGNVVFHRIQTLLEKL